MKKIFILLTLLVLILTACSAASTTTSQATTAQNTTTDVEVVSPTEATSAQNNSKPGNSPSFSTDYANAVPIPMQLMIGIFQLEDTDLAITSAQAASLLPILTSAKDLTTSGSTTQEQIDSLVQQVQSILTAEQIQAIARMQITQETAMTLMQKQGNSMGNPPQGNGNPPPQGNLPQGTPPADAPNGQPPSGVAMGTPPANGNQPSMSSVPPPLFDALIQLMQGKTTNS